MKTFKYKTVHSILWVSAMLLVCIGCQEYPNEYKSTDGIPEVLYVRIPDVAAADSLLDGAFLGTTICIVGNNLRSVHDLSFNDQPALLNTSLITDHTLIVTVPGNIPEVVTDNMYLRTKKGDEVVYPFKSKVPAPIISAISCEYALDGWEAILYGDYFIDDPNIPLKILMAGNLPVTQIVDIQKTEVRFVVPNGAQKGYINLETIYGKSRSRFIFRDDRGIILDFDNLRGNGWRTGNLASDGGISGRYAVLKGAMDDDTWNDDGFEIDLWSRAPEGDFFDASPSNMDQLLLKFEANVVETWSSCAMQFIFQPWSTQGNSYFQEATVNRGLWIPWVASGSFKSDGWITVTIPMSEFKYDKDGKVIDLLGPGNYGGLTIFVWKGGIPGTPCNPEIWLDNIRVVPVE